MRSVWWTLEATQDRENIFDWIEVDNPAAAADLDELWSRKAEVLGEHPAAGRPGRVAGTRELVVHRNYVLIYDVTADKVRVLRLLHARRKWPSTIPEQQASFTEKEDG